MAALPIPKYGLDKLYLFPFYQTREQYRLAVGEEPPPFNPTRPPQGWFDPQMKNSTKRTVIYENVLAVNEKGQPKRDEEGRPYFEPLMILRSEAATVNIPLKLASGEPGAEVPEVPPPVRALDPDEELIFDFLGVVMVRNKKLNTETPVNYSAQDREILRAIARKLNVAL
jgi:hypothetical protein